jgi:hypothetical protein
MRWTAVVRFLAREDIFLLPIQSRLALGLAQPPVKWIPGALPTLGNRQGRESVRSPPHSVEVKKGGDMPPFPNMLSLPSA